MKIFKIIISFIFVFSLFLIPTLSYSAYPKLVGTLNSAFEKIESWIITISTPAAAVAVR